jgi:HD-like signal output (HDOD) protein
MTKKTVLFVDDDPHILEGLRTRLHRLSRKWVMRFVGSSRAALDLMAREPVDVIVSDMRMPEMDGTTLLKLVQERHPRIVRIVLSGHAEVETALRAIPVAHQFLSKPCEAGVLENVVERACSLQGLINEDVVRTIVSRIDRLPSLPQLYTQLVAALANENLCADDIARILKQDLAMCAKILQIVNSAFFRLSRSISRVEEAVSYLGFNTIKQIVLAVEIFSYSAAGNGRLELPLQKLQSHAVAVGGLGAALFSDKRKKEDAFVAGLLHDIGKLVLCVELPDDVERVTQEMRAENCAMNVAEQHIFGVTHAEIGGYLLGLWGLPFPIVEAVANHHTPGRVEHDGLGILTAVHIADWLVNHPQRNGEHEAGRQTSGLDLDYLERLGVAAQLDTWIALADRETATTLP